MHNYVFWVIKKVTSVYIIIVFKFILQFFDPYLNMSFLDLKLTKSNITHIIFYYFQMFFYSIISYKIFTWKNNFIFLEFYYYFTLLSLKKIINLIIFNRTAIKLGSLKV